MKNLFVWCFSIGMVVMCQAQEYPGTVIMPDGTAREGIISASNARAYHQEISFRDRSDNKKYTYLPGELKEFVVQGPVAMFYESLMVDSTGAHFFRRKFEDDRIKYYYYIYKKKGKKDVRGEYLVEVYMVDDKIVNIDYNREDELLRDMDDESWVKGGVIQSSGDTLTGLILTKFANDDKKVTFQDGKTRQVEKFEIEALNGYFVENLAFEKLTLENKRKPKDAMLRIVLGANETMQLYADYKQRSKGAGMPFGPSFGGLSLIYTPTYLDVNYFLKKKDSDELLSIMAGFMVTKKADIESVRSFFSDYPALGVAIVRGTINQEKAIVNIYNLYKSL